MCTMFTRMFYHNVVCVHYIERWSRSPLSLCPRGLSFTWWGCRGLCFWHIPTELAHSFSFGTYVYFCLCGRFSGISFRKFSQRLSVFSLCSSGLISALLFLTTMYLFMKVSFSPDIFFVWLTGLKAPTNCLAHSLSLSFYLFPSRSLMHMWSLTMH